MSTITRLKVDELSVDPRVQRRPDPVRVRKLADTWDPRMVGVLTVSHRIFPGEDGGTEAYVVLDGQTRMLALEMVAAETEFEEATVTCEVFEGLTFAEEAAMFLRHNDRKAVTPRDLFRLAVASEEEWALNIRDIAAEHGWYVQGTTPASATGFRIFTAIGAVEKVYNLDDGRALRRTFDVIDRAWGRTGGVVSSETVYGIGLLFASHPTGIDGSGLVHKLSKIGINRFVSAIHDRKRATPGMSVRKAAQEYTVDLYNRGRRTHRV